MCENEIRVEILIVNNREIQKQKNAQKFIKFI